MIIRSTFYFENPTFQEPAFPKFKDDSIINLVAYIFCDVSLVFPMNVSIKLVIAFFCMRF
jgi:hypothetical protein